MIEPACFSSMLKQVSTTREPQPCTGHHLIQQEPCIGKQTEPWFGSNLSETEPMHWLSSSAVWAKHWLISQPPRIKHCAHVHGLEPNSTGCLLRTPEKCPSLSSQAVFHLKNTELCTSYHETASNAMTTISVNREPSTSSYAVKTIPWLLFQATQTIHWFSSQVVAYPDF
jgi:hypothetical protein